MSSHQYSEHCAVLPAAQTCLTIEAATVQGVIQEPGVGEQRRSEHKHARVKTVGPARIRSSRQLVPVKQLVHVTQHLGGTGGQHSSPERRPGGCILKGRHTYFYIQ